MIYNLNPSKNDFQLLKGKENNIGENLDYSNSIVKKPWGYEYLVFENENVAIWMLHIARTQKTSMHSHPNKTTALILLGGDRAKIASLDKEYVLRESDCLMIGKSAFHSTESVSDISTDPMSENGIWVMEIESPVDKSDLVRLKDNYGRVGVAYEGVKNIVDFPVKCLKLEYAKQEVQEYDFFNQKLIMLQSNTCFNTIKNTNSYVFLIKHNDKGNKNIGIAINLHEAKKIFSNLEYKNSGFLIIQTNTGSPTEPKQCVPPPKCLLRLYYN